MGTYAGALEARQITAAGERFRAEATGEIEKEEGVLVIKRIHVSDAIEGRAAARETAERVLGDLCRPLPGVSVVEGGDPDHHLARFPGDLTAPQPGDPPVRM